MFRFKIAPFRASYRSGTLTVNRPAPPVPPKAPTLMELIAERAKLAKYIDAVGKKTFACPPDAGEKLASLDRRIGLLAGAK